MITYIYALIDPRTSLIRYIGKTNDPDRRLGKHLFRNDHTHKARWIRGLMREGLEPQLTILEETDSKYDSDRERYWITFGRSEGWPLTNLTDGGEGTPGRIVPASVRDRISASLLGHTVSDECRKRIGDSRRGKKRGPLSDETRKRIGDVHRGKKRGPLSQSCRQHLSESIKSVIAQKKIDGSSWSHVVSCETRQKIGESNKGHPVSQETRSKISERMKEVWKSRKRIGEL